MGDELVESLREKLNYTKEGEVNLPPPATKRGYLSRKYDRVSYIVVILSF
jgi:hypothetical protein